MALRHRMVGNLASLYWRVFRPRTLGVRAIVVDRNDRIALVRHTYADAWYLPGGGVQKAESFEAALYRELREEVALADARIERVLGIYHSRSEAKDDHIVIFVVRCDGAVESALPNADPREIEEARWFALDELPPGVSPATNRRIAEYRDGAIGLGSW